MWYFKYMFRRLLTRPLARMQSALMAAVFVALAAGLLPVAHGIFAAQPAQFQSTMGVVPADALAIANQTIRHGGTGGEVLGQTSNNGGHWHDLSNLQQVTSGCAVGGCGLYGFIEATPVLPPDDGNPVATRLSGPPAPIMGMPPLRPPSLQA